MERGPNLNVQITRPAPRLGDGEGGDGGRDDRGGNGGEFAEPVGYLDFARYGPISAAVAERLVWNAGLIHTQGASALDTLDQAATRTRASAAVLLAAAEHEIAFVGSTSHGLFAAAAALSGRSGTVLVTRSDFPANVYPWLRTRHVADARNEPAYGSLATDGRHAYPSGVRVRLIDGPVTADTIRAHLDDDVIAIAVCAVDAGTGAVAPLGSIKELIGPDRVLVVDAVQGLGAIPIEADAADVLASGGQKWLRAGWGTALLLVRDRVADLLEPRLGGWSGVVDPIDGHDHPHDALRGAVAHTLTNPDGPAVDALGTAIDLVLEAGVERIGAAIQERLRLLLETARSAGADVVGPVGSGIGSFRLPDRDPGALHKTLTAAGIDTTLRNGWIRLSPHASTDPAATELLAEALTGARTATPQNTTPRDAATHDTAEHGTAKHRSTSRPTPPTRKVRTDD
jgi:selenocysteine lyase/cysteine desulfurase